MNAGLIAILLKKKTKTVNNKKRIVRLARL